MSNVPSSSTRSKLISTRKREAVRRKSYDADKIWKGLSPAHEARISAAKIIATDTAPDILIKINKFKREVERAF